MINGQIDMFSYLKTQEPEQDVPKLYQTGQYVWMVNKGDVEQYKVLSESWLNKCGDRGYRLHNGQNYNTTLNSEHNVNCFTEYNKALELAETYLNTHEVIRAEDIKPIKTVAYRYIRECDKRCMIAFYSELEDGSTYIREFVTYAHIVLPAKRTEALKRFNEQDEFKHSKVEEFEYKPSYKNMYRTKDSDWDYAEAGYSRAVG